MTEHQPYLPFPMRKRPFIVRLWRHFWSYREVGLSVGLAARYAWWMARCR